MHHRDTEFPETTEKRVSDRTTRPFILLRGLLFLGVSVVNRVS
jgi:hypothetical protein